MLSTWFSNLAVKRKISLLVGFFSLILICMVVLANLEVGNAQARTEAMYNDSLLPTGDLTMVRTSLLRALVLANNHLRASSPEAAAAIEGDMNKMDENFDAAWSRYEKSFHSEVARTVGPKYHDIALEQRRIRREILLPLSRKGDLAGARKVLAEQIDATDQQLGPLGAQLVKDNAQQAATALVVGKTAYWRGMIGGILFSVLGILGASLVGWFVIKGIHGPLNDFGQVLGRVAQGDLTARATIDRKDEFGTLGQNLNTMVSDLRTVLQGVRGSVEGVASGATELSASAEQMSRSRAGMLVS